MKMKRKRSIRLLAVVLLMCMSASALAGSIEGLASEEGLAYDAVEQADHADSVTCRFAMEEGATYADGTTVSARDYLCAWLLRRSPEWAELAPDEDAYAATGWVSPVDWANSDMRLISDDVFEITIGTDDELLRNLWPCSPERLGLELKEDAEGTHLVGDTGKAIALLLSEPRVVNMPPLPVPLGMGEGEGEEQSETPEEASALALAAKPADAPAAEPVAEPVAEPATAPVAEPAAEPTSAPAAEPTEELAVEPTDAPEDEPTSAPAETETGDGADEPAEEPVEEQAAEPPAEAMHAIEAAIAGDGFAYVRTNDQNVVLYQSAKLGAKAGVIKDGGSLLFAVEYFVHENQDGAVKAIFSDGERLVDGYVWAKQLEPGVEDAQAMAEALKDSRFAVKGHPIAAIAYEPGEREEKPLDMEQEDAIVEEAIATEAAQWVADLIAALPATIAITQEGIAPLYEAWLAYQALPEEERAMVENAQQLESLWAFMRSSLPVETLRAVDAIDALPGEIVTQEDALALQEVFLLLAALSDEQLLLVYNVGKLSAMAGGIMPLSVNMGMTYSARVVWNEGENAADLRPDTVTLTLYANGMPYVGEGGSVDVDTAVGTYVWSDLPELDDEENPIVYSVKQSVARGYRTTYAYADETGEMVITNIRLAGNLALKLVDGANFRIRYASQSDVMTIVAQYTTYLADEKQTLRIILPPFFDLAAPPSSGVGYTVTTQTVPLPAEYYPGADAALLRAEPASRTNCKQITVAFDETVSGNFVLTFGINIIPSASATSTTQYLSELMVKYGENPDQIPLNIVAIAEDAEGVMLNDSVLYGNSAITNADGSAAFESLISFPRSSASTSLLYSLGDNYTSRTTAGYYYNTVALAPYYSTAAALTAFTNWHYPYTDMYLYFPLPEKVSIGYIMGQGVAPGSQASNFWLEGETSINGKRYAKIGVNSAYTLNVYSAPSIPTLRATPNYYYDALTYIFPDMDTLLPGEVFEMGDVYIDYTHKGVGHEKEKIWNVKDYTVPSYYQPSLGYSFLTNAGGFDSTAVWHDRLQGQKADQYRVSWSNQSSSQMTYVYEDASVRIEFPYEVVPTSVTCTGTHYVSGSSYTGLPALTETVYPNSASYWIYGDDTEYIIPMTGASAVFPNVHVSKIALNYDTLFSASQYTYTIVADNGKVDANGKELGERYATQLKTSLLTKTGTRLKAAEDPDKRLEEAYTLSALQTIYLIQYPDALLFGTRYSTNYKTTTTYCYNAEDQYRVYDSSYRWTFSLTKSKSQMKDYENVKITINAADADSSKAVSKIAGFNVGTGYLAFASKILIQYKTNKSGGTYKTYAVTNSGNNYLLLGSDEYVVGEIVIDLGRIDGSKMTATSTASLTLTNDYWSNNSTQHTIIPLFNEYRYYYAGNSTVVNEYPVSSADAHTLVATISTSSAAKHITGEGLTGTEKSNNSSTGTVKYTTQWSNTITRGASTTASGWNNASKVYYRGNTIKATLSFTSFYTSSITWAGGTYYHNFDDLLLYLEVQTGFGLSSLTGFELQEVRELDNGNNLYVYRYPSVRISAGGTIVSSAVATIVVLPDAPIGLQTIIPNAGFSLDGFARDYMTPVDTYYLNEPYYKYTLPTNRNFPAHWNIAVSSAPEGMEDPFGYAQHQVTFSYGDYTDVTIQVANVDRIAVLPGVAGAIQANPAPFYDYQKGNLFARAWMSNSTESEIVRYEAAFQLPRKGRTTLGYSDGQVTGSMNDFSLYLKGPVTFGSSTPEEGKYQIVYYCDSTEITPSSAADWQSVTEVHVFLDDFPALTTFDCVFDLMTDEVKVGDKTDDIFACLGAARRYVAPNEITGSLEAQEFLYSAPAEYAFQSLWLKVRVGEDRSELGSYYTTLSNVAEITVYYQGEGDVEKELYKSSTGYLHNVRVNADATRVTARILDNYQHAYMMTVQNNLSLSESQDSDFPRVMPHEVSSMDINTMDLVGTTTAGNKYDINLTRRPTAVAADLYLRTGQPLPAVVTLGYNGNPIAKYKVAYELIGPDNIASMTPEGMATGIAKGETAYRVTVTNTLGTLPCDTVTAEAKIFVVDDFRVAMRTFWDDNYNGALDEGEEIVAFPDIAVAQEYFWLSTANGATAAKQPSREPAYDTDSGYYSFQVPSLIQLYATARNPAGTVITDENAARSGAKSPVVTGANAGYAGTFTGSNLTYGSIVYNFGMETRVEGNLQLTTYIDFPIERPHTVTFKAENGTIVQGTNTSGMITVNGSPVQVNPVTGEAFTQKRYWHNTSLSYIYYAAQVVADEGYTWPGVLGTGSPYYNWRNWKRTDNGSNTLKVEYSGWQSTPVVEDMTLVAVPSKVVIHARAFYDENRNGIWDVGEEIVQNPTIYLVPGSGTYTVTSGRIDLVQEQDSTYSSAPIPNIDMTLWGLYTGSAGVDDCNKPDAMRFTTAAVSVPGRDTETRQMTLNTSNYAYGSMRTDYTSYANVGDFYVDIALQRPYTVIFTAENGAMKIGTQSSATYSSHVVGYDTGDPVQLDEDGNTFIEGKFWPNDQLYYVNYYAQVTANPHYAWATATGSRQWRGEYGGATEVKTETAWYNNPTFRVHADMRLVALPTRTEYQVIYDKNAVGASGTTEDMVWYAPNADVSVKGNAFDYPKFLFIEWNTHPDGNGTAYNPEAIFKMPSNDITLYAQWSPPYAVEHYWLDVNGNKPGTLVATDDRNGITGAEAAFTSNTYDGCAFEPSLTEPADKAILEDGSLVIKLYYSRNTDTKYIVEHYWLDLDGNKPGTLVGTDDMTGVTGAEAALTLKTFDGFTFEPRLTEPADRTILGNGSLVVKLYYSRDVDTRYKVEHYWLDLDGNKPGTLAGTEDKTGTTGAEAAFVPKTFDGFTFEPSLADPADKTILGDGSLVIKLYYSRDMDTKYKVEHYWLDLNGNMPGTLEATDELSGTTGAEAAFAPKTYDGLTFEPSLSEPADKTILGNGSLVIRLYYSRNTDNQYTVEHYMQELDGSYSAFPVDTESFTGITGDQATFRPKNYSGFKYEAVLTTPANVTIMGSGSLVIKLHYSRNKNTPYRVEHYLQSSSNNTLYERDAAQNLTGVTGAAAAFTPKTYADYAYVPSMTRPQNPTIDGGGKLVIKLYYRSIAAPGPTPEYVPEPIPPSPFIPESLVDDLITSLRENAHRRVSELVSIGDMGIPLSGVSSKNIGDCFE